MVFLIQLQRLAPRVACLAAAPNSSRRFGPANEVKERLHCQALQRLSELNSRLRISNCLVSPPRNSETSTPPAEAKSASLSESPVSAFLGSRLYISISVLPMKSKSDFTVRPSEAHDVLDPPATGRGALRRAALVGADQGACAFCSYFECSSAFIFFRAFARSSWTVRSESLTPLL